MVHTATKGRQVHQGWRREGGQGSAMHAGDDATSPVVSGSTPAHSQEKRRAVRGVSHGRKRRLNAPDAA